jgi:hypothetical protein
MATEDRCKRIIDGRTYNTQTATRLGSWFYWDDNPSEPRDGATSQTLYQTRHGAFFLYCQNEIAELWEAHEWIEPLASEEAQKWMEQQCSPEEIEAVFGTLPEAGDAEARITIRMPETLRRRLASVAEHRRQSLNAWIVRCLERSAETVERETART